MDKMDVAKRFSLDVSWVFFSSVITLVIGFLIRPLLARWLGPEGLGFYSIILMVYSITLIFGSFGLPMALTKYVSEFKKDNKKLSQFATSGLLSSLIFGTIVGFILYFLSEIIADFFDMPKLLIPIKLLACVLPFAAFLEGQINILNGLRAMKHFTVLVISQQILMICFIIVFIALGYGINGAVIGILLSSMITVVFGQFILKRFINLDFDELIPNMKKIIPFGGKLAATNSVNTINTRLDIIMVGYFLMATDVGYYSVALALSQFFWFIPLSIQRITYPFTAQYWNEEDHEMLKKMLSKVMKISTLILLLVGLVITFFAGDIIFILFGEGFTYAIIPLFILLIGAIIRGCICQPIGGSLTAINRPDLPLKISIFMISVNMLLNILLIPKFGIIGAAIATSISLSGGAVIFLWLTVKKLSLKFDLKWYAGICIIVLVIIALFRYATEVINIYLAGGVMLCIFIVITYFFFVDIEEKALFMNILRSFLGRR